LQATIARQSVTQLCECSFRTQSDGCLSGLGIAGKNPLLRLRAG